MRCFHCNKSISTEDIKVDINIVARKNARSSHGLLFHVNCFEQIAGSQYLNALKKEVLDKPQGRSEKEITINRSRIRKLKPHANKS